MAEYVRIGEFIYIGKSTDTKPVDVPNGVKCIENDTFDKYATCDNGATWIKYEEGKQVDEMLDKLGDISDKSSDIIDKLKDIVEIIKEGWENHASKTS